MHKNSLRKKKSENQPHQIQYQSQSRHVKGQNIISLVSNKYKSTIYHFSHLIEKGNN